MTCSICQQSGHNKRTCPNQQKATTGKYAGMTAAQIEAIFAERERKNYEELVAPIIAPKSACADCGQIETECHLELVGGKVMCCDCIDPKPTEEEEEEEEDTCECCGKPFDHRNPHRQSEMCDCVQNDDGTLSRPEVCECCDATLGEDEHIFIFTRGDEEKTMCQMCGEDTHEEMNADGWRRDDEEEEEEEEQDELCAAIDASGNALF